MTRREWFLEVGAGVVLAGWSAADLDAAELPPGIYEASRDHLSHALAGNRLAAGGETELVELWKAPVFFTQAEYRTLLDFVALMLGEPREAPMVTEIAAWIDMRVAESAAVRSAARAMLPGHRTLAVHYYGAESVRRLEDFDAQKICREGMAWLSGKAPLSEVIRSVSDDRPKPREDNAGTRFFDYVKRGVIEGFYTSRVGLEELGRGLPLFSASPPGCSR
jgi:hypothetical protein